MTTARISPATLTGELAPRLSRWLWLVKWVLVFPHAFLLFFLSIAAFFTTIIAGFAILFTGRYPRSLFDFAVGVLRWNWRVAFYSYSALGVDKYPPFTLQKTDYPADFDVEYPEKLINGLVLVKWWLLAIPHYLVLALIVGATYNWSPRTDSPADRPLADAGRWGHYLGADSTPGLLAILVLIAAVILLFTARYPQALFDFVMGLNRWVYRVYAYVFLLTDAYPPFRLDQGATEPPTIAPTKA
ncbi:MAG: DUF4389 domain-containing protein [Pseudolysinimonas sp.]